MSSAIPPLPAWPFAEARRIVQVRRPAGDRPVLLETGFGPSGLPHIGTFAEVARTTWVRHAFEHLTGLPTRLVAFSDDMDGLRKVPLNLPQPEMLGQHLGKPLHAIPDPFGQCESYSAHMNRKLREFLDAYGFDYEFRSSRDAYREGDFDEGLGILLDRVEEVRGLVLATLREENRQGWSPFFPLCPRCGSVYATRVTGYHAERGSLDFACDGQIGQVRGCGADGEIGVLGGRVKVGWKVDWALRWFTYQVDYEMYGKDLIDSAQLSGRIVRLMGREPPVGLTYELFLDEEGRKISKSVGRGLSVEQWTRYAPLESLLYYLFANPQRARRLYWDVVPRCVDEYLAELRRYPHLAAGEQPELAVWHVGDRGRHVPRYDSTVDFSMVSNLIAALGTDSAELLVEYLERYDPAALACHEVTRSLVEKGLGYYRDFVLPGKRFRAPDAQEQKVLERIRQRLAASGGADEEALQAIPFDVAREMGLEARAVFRAFYEVVLGQERGPRFGSFVRLVGRERMLETLARRLVHGP
ncbi:MAG: lysine--tRNA ligase [Candidatus Latescibacterota bacterium]